jgi:hypothetical protein
MRVFLLALGTIKDRDVKLGGTTVVIEQQDPSLMQIIFFGKTRPTALEKHITLTVIVNF